MAAGWLGRDCVKCQRMKPTTVIFSHGHLSSPDSHKIKELAPTAEAQGHATEAIDYRDLQDDPIARSQRLIEHIDRLNTPPILVGSSMGGYVAMAAAQFRSVAGLFLMAPALFMENRVPGGVVPEKYEPATDHISVVHGWNDEVIDWRRSLKFAEQSGAALHLLDTDHRMASEMTRIEQLFDGFLRLPG